MRMIRELVVFAARIDECSHLASRYERTVCQVRCGDHADRSTIALELSGESGHLRLDVGDDLRQFISFILIQIVALQHDL